MGPIIFLEIIRVNETRGKQSTEVRITQKIFKKKKEETLTERKNRSPNEGHAQIHGSLFETFRRSQMSFSIRRE